MDRETEQILNERRVGRAVADEMQRERLAHEYTSGALARTLQIEKELRAEVERLASDYTNGVLALTRSLEIEQELRAENERLRKALDTICGIALGDMKDPDFPASKVRRIATTALDG